MKIKNNSFLNFLIASVEPIVFGIFLIFSFCDNTYLFSLFGRYFHVSFWISIIAIPLYFIFIILNKKLDFLKKITILVIPIFLLLSITSLGNAIILDINYFNFLGSSPIKIFAESWIKYLYDLVVIIYIICHFANSFSYKYKKIVYYSFFVWIFIGLAQILLVIIDSPRLWLIYEKMDFLKILAHKEIFDLAKIRFYSFLSEPSQNAKIICLIYLPFFSLNVFKNNAKNKDKIINGIFILLTFICAFLTKSSTVYVGIIVFTIVLIIVLLTDKSKPKMIPLIFIGTIIVLFAVLFAIPYTRTTIIYLLNEKIFGTDSFSTRYRYSSVYNDLLIFIHYPFFGVGDGMQGLFYLKNIAGTWMSYSQEAQQSLSGNNGVIEGGAVVPSFLSGFGLFGIAVISFGIKNIIRKMNLFKVKSSDIKLFYLPAFISFLIVMVVAADFHRNYPLFIFLSIPFFKNFRDNQIVTTENIYYSIDI